MLRNSPHSFGWPARWLHWLTAAAVIAALVLSVVTWYLGRRKQFGNQLFPVTLVHRGMRWKLWDTGTVEIS